jgi:hypothetical protein
MVIVEEQAEAESVAGAPSADVDEFWFRGGEDRQRLPVWARWLVNLGRRTANGGEPPRRMVAAIAVPTRAFAATFCGVGCVIGDPLRFTAVATDAEELEAHFENLCALRPGSTVTVASGSAKHVGRFVRADELQGERYLVIEQDGDSKQAFTQYIPLREAHNVAVRGLGLSCLIIGKVTQLEQEICSGEVITADGRPLQELLKTRRFASRRETDIRCDVIATAAELPGGLRDAQPGVVIFDGAEAFRRWKEAWRRSAWLVVLDRTSRQFDEAALLVEQEFVERRYDDGDPLADLDVPPGIEVAAFWGRRL